MQRVFYIFLAVFVLLPTHAQNPSSKTARSHSSFEFKDGDRVVFLGDTWIEREQQESYIEARITSRLQGKKVIFRNLGWSADTLLGESRAGFDPPAKGFDRLKEEVAAVKPTVVFFGYGMAESFKGAAGVAQFKADYNKLIEAIADICKPDALRMVFLTPIAHENLGAPLPDPTAHNEQLKLYAEAIRQIADERNSTVIDLFALTTQYAKSKSNRHLTDNGIHPTPFGFWQIAFFIEQGLGLGTQTWRTGITQAGSVREGSTGIEVSSFSRHDQEISINGVSRHSHEIGFAGADQFMSVEPPPGGTTGEYKGSALMQFVGLPEGNYMLLVDGEPAAKASATEWGRGFRFNRGPAFDQAAELRKEIVKKNELFFHRWRPQNQTYLFGFRKYEQGKNAREIPMFDPLIQQEEARILELTKLRRRSYKLVSSTPELEQKLAAEIKPVKKEIPADFDATPLPTPSFELADGLEVTLFAENPDLAKPIQMNFDPQGRLWVASSEVYPQIKPGQVANDKILILEDTDHDGKSDKTTVFTDGLLIPTGVIPGDGGAYVANSTELLFYKDTNGDGRADEKHVMLSGFGTEDTHHILHTLRWGFDGQLYMNQSIYIHSHIETPNGVERLRSGGIWNFRPSTYELGVHLKGLINPWGHHFDKYGQSFATDGAGGEGINWVIPQAMYVTYEGARRILGSVSPGSYPKFCSLEVIESEHFPEDWQGTMVTCDFRAHRVVRFGIEEQGGGYITRELPDVMRSTNVTFRPIDVKVGPDGAIYIADWSNPIIQHGEVDFRDPRRDHEHGRIWKLTYKGRKQLTWPDLIHASNTELLENLHSKNGELRQHSRRVLTEREAAILPDLENWTKKQETEQGKLEALWMYQSIDQVNAPLLKEVLTAKDGRIRAAATRVLSFWENRLDQPLDELALLVSDEHPRVRIEAMRAAAKIETPRSAELVLSAVDRPMDRFVDYAAWLSINDLADEWLEGIRSGKWKGSEHQKQLEFGLNAIEPKLASSVLEQVLPAGALPQDGSGPWLNLIAKAGSKEQLQRVFELALADETTMDGRSRALQALNEAARVRQLKPEEDEDRVSSLFENESAEIQAGAIRLAGQWKLGKFTTKILKLAKESKNAQVRQAAFDSLRQISGDEAQSGLAKLAAASNGNLSTRIDALKALATINAGKAAPLSIDVLTQLSNEDQALDLWRALLSTKGAAPLLTQVVPKSGLPEPVVKAGLRAAREGGRNEPNLVLALARNLDGGETAKAVSPEELKTLLGSIREKGDPHRGELIFRRQELGCVSCHAIGGVGGKVGPDLTSIGASAPVDYLVESLQFPNAKVKEGYHAVVIETKDGQELSGILVRETDDQLIVRSVSNQEVSVPKNNIEKRTIGGSLMPAGLVDALNENEQADLYRFLSELGKPGPFDASKGTVARTWRLMPRTLDLAQFDDVKAISMDQSHWARALTLVDGRLPKAELTSSLKQYESRSPDAIYASTRFETAKGGQVRVELPTLEKAIVWIDGKMITSKPVIEANLAAGAHSLTVKLDQGHLPAFLRAATSDGTFIND